MYVCVCFLVWHVEPTDSVSWAFLSHCSYSLTSLSGNEVMAVAVSLRSFIKHLIFICKALRVQNWQGEDGLVQKASNLEMKAKPLGWCCLNSSMDKEVCSPPGLSGDFIVEKIRNEVNVNGMSSNMGLYLESYLYPAKPLQSTFKTQHILHPCYCSM